MQDFWDATPLRLVDGYRRFASTTSLLNAGNYQPTRCYIPEDSNLHQQRCQNSHLDNYIHTARCIYRFKWHRHVPVNTTTLLYKLNHHITLANLHFWQPINTYPLNDVFVSHRNTSHNSNMYCTWASSKLNSDSFLLCSSISCVHLNTL
jgi:hypothetical protein